MAGKELSEDFYNKEKTNLLIPKSSGLKRIKEVSSKIFWNK